MEKTQAARYLKFESAGASVAALALLGVAGTEQLGNFYEYHLFLQHEPGPLSADELDALLLAPCSITMGPAQNDTVHGILREIELTASFSTGPAQYRATVVPSVWLMTLSRVSRVFLDQSVLGMAKALLEKYGLEEGQDFEFRTSAASRKDGQAGGPGHRREFCIQYDETDWDFLQRWLEHEGLYYWFEHLEEGERLILGDAPPRPIAEPSKMTYHEWQGEHPVDTVTKWQLVQRRIPARVVLKDYNYRNPSLPMTAQSPVDSKRGFGSVILYGEHFRDDKAGEALAARRAEQLRCERRTFAGLTECTRFRVGHSFALEGHFDSSNNAEYLITSVDLRIGTSGEANPDEMISIGFTAIPADVPFRPRQTVPWPSIHGVMHAHIDSDSSGTYATIDEMGRYRVKFPFDVDGGKGDGASAPIRLAQPYAGMGYGSHFPLHKGTEVLVAFLDGDPDRPIVIGAVPNASTPSPSVGQNATESVIATASGIRISMEDKI